MRFLLDPSIAGLPVDNKGTTLAEVLVKHGEVTQTTMAEYDVILGPNCFRVNEVVAKRVETLVKGIKKEVERKNG